MNDAQVTSMYEDELPAEEGEDMEAEDVTTLQEATTPAPAPTPLPADDSIASLLNDDEEDILPSLADELEAISFEAETAAEDDIETDAGEDTEAPEGEEAESATEETGEALTETPDTTDEALWYVIHCYSGYENKVRSNLNQRIESMGMKSLIFDVVVPTEEEIEVREGKRRTIERRVFPGYILVQMILTEESWYVVRNTPGVTGFVGMGNDPTPLQDKEVSQIIRRMEAEAPKIKVAYKIGQRVRIIDGPFNDFVGTVGEIDMERAKVRVLVSFFGRETPVELDFLQVERA